ncbi:HWE histidine kinase domain-containing protein [Methylorubrum sp. SB2]|uniref:HWE histidine kinase domain-containing protein n=1 Tax=Methylorubrum subtropicum TaxID=3138812 RepID=UPI00313B2162
MARGRSSPTTEKAPEPVDEGQHPVKSMLAPVRAIAGQTSRNAYDHAAANEAFSARLISPGRAHDILTRPHLPRCNVARLHA